MLLLLLTAISATVPLVARADPACVCQYHDQAVPVAPVCGTDGDTYASRCDLECAAAAVERTAGGMPPLSLAYEGPCQYSRTRAVRATGSWADDLQTCLEVTCTIQFGDCSKKCAVDDDPCWSGCAQSWQGCMCACKKWLPPSAASASSSASSSAWAGPGQPAMTLTASSTQMALATLRSRKGLQEMSQCLSQASTSTTACNKRCAAGDTTCVYDCAKAGLDSMCRCGAATARQAVLVLLLAAAARWLLPQL